MVSSIYRRCIGDSSSRYLDNIPVCLYSCFYFWLFLLFDVRVYLYVPVFPSNVCWAEVDAPESGCWWDEWRN